MKMQVCSSERACIFLFFSNIIPIFLYHTSSTYQARSTQSFHGERTMRRKKLQYFFGGMLAACVAFVGFLVISADDTDITRENIFHAEQLIGLQFTDAKRDSMMEGLTQYRTSYAAIRDYGLKNSVPPSLLFNPLPAGYSSGVKQAGLTFQSISDVRLPEDLNELAFYSIRELAELIRTRRITSVELTEFYLERLKRYGPVLECVITLTEERAMRKARQVDEEIAAGKYRGLLHGIPYGIKDLFSTSDYKTTWGAVPFKDQMIDYDATVVRKLDDAGAVLVAKLTLGALAWGDVWFGGMTRNPWDVTQGSSGSSAGSAAAVAAGLVPFAIGTETYGSIVSPATVNGVTGLRPSYGRVSRYGAMALSWSMDKVGPLTRHAEDAAIVFEAIRGPDGLDRTIYDLPFQYNADIDISGLRIGYVKIDFDAEYPFHGQDSLTLETLRELGAELIPIELPDVPVHALGFILSAEAAAAFDALTLSGKDDLMVLQIKNAWPNVFRQARFIPAVEYINANRIRYELIQEMYELMETVDLYVAPSWQGPNLLLTNLTGHPCVVIPNGFSDGGTPTSISFTGRLFDEGRILAVAYAVQNATGFHQAHPALPE
jgi:Asp-tRNA(Asn)/Glu-tRNA(Gln) amidotransferase A subunit family amidase